MDKAIEKKLNGINTALAIIWLTLIVAIIHFW